LKSYAFIDKYELLKCKNCKVIFLKNIEEFLSSQNLYDKDYFENYLYDTELNFQSIKATALYYLNFIQNYFRKINTLLDVGAGFGLFVKAFQDLGLNADGIEISKYSVQIAKEKFGVELFNGNLLEFNSIKKYDLISFYHSFEHLSDPVHTIKKVRELLNENGILWLSLPNVMSLDRFIRKENWNGWSLPYHFFHYSPVSIKNLLKREGFRQIKIQKSFLNPLKLMKSKSESKNFVIENPRTKSLILKEWIRKPATWIFSGQNMNVYAIK
jgi:2-polyprenyl-3-methyl-5-hydroxy-6-metoxy-1,4-benzoquinol methylase